jgi:hypothetical protein
VFEIIVQKRMYRPDHDIHVILFPISRIFDNKFHLTACQRGILSICNNSVLKNRRYENDKVSIIDAEILNVIARIIEGKVSYRQISL